VLEPEKILAIISKEAAVDRARLVPGATLEELAIASLDVINILFAIEDECGVELEPQEFENVHTLQEFMDVILSKTAAVPTTAVSQS
jgi:acyl carrier protein